MNAREKERQYSLCEAVADLSALMSAPVFAPVIPNNSREIVRMVIEWATIFEAHNKDREWDGEYLMEIEKHFTESYAAWKNEADEDECSPHPMIHAVKSATGRNDLILEARAAFVKIIKQENFDSYDRKQSLKAGWAGPLSGFHDPALQKRWESFLEGWTASRATQP